MEPTQRAKFVLEAALFTALQPLSEKRLLALFGESITQIELTGLLNELKQDWQNRGLELVHVSSGWRFQTSQFVKQYLDQLHTEKPAKYSRATLEVLAVIAYKQPVTRGDVEAIRGVAVSSQIMRQLEERDWIEVVGHKEVVGKPALWATTTQFLADLGLQNLSELPLLEAGEQFLSEQLNEVTGSQPDSPQNLEITNNESELN